MRNRRQADGIRGMIKRRADFMIGLCGDKNAGLYGDPEDISLHRALLLTVVQVEQMLELVRSCRRRVPIIIRMSGLNKYKIYINRYYLQENKTKAVSTLYELKLN